MSDKKSKLESLLSNLLEGSKDENSIFDFEGNKIGDLVNGKLIVEGKEIQSRVLVDNSTEE